MAGCGQCPSCNCSIVDEEGTPYAGSGESGDPVVIPRSQNTPWEGVSSDGTISITPGDVDNVGDGHAPDLRVNMCNALDYTTSREYGDVLIFNEDEEDCRPEVLRDPIDGEFLGLDPGSGKAGWVQGAVVSSGAVPTGTLLPFIGPEVSVPSGYVVAGGQTVSIASYPVLYSVIGHVGSGFVDPGGGNFVIPDLRGRAFIGLDDMGSGGAAGRVAAATTDGYTAGTETVVLGTANLPSHTHTITDPGHSHAAAGAHEHTPSTGGRYFVTVNSPPENFLIANDTPDELGIVVSDADDAQKNNEFTSTDPGHTHPGAATGITGTNATGSGTAHSNLQPLIAGNWIIKT